MQQKCCRPSDLVKRACLSWPCHARAAIGSELCGSLDSSEFAVRFDVIENGERLDGMGIADSTRGILSDTESPPKRRILVFGISPGVLRFGVNSDKSGASLHSFSGSLAASNPV